MRVFYRRLDFGRRTRHRIVVGEGGANLARAIEGNDEFVCNGRENARFVRIDARRLERVAAWIGFVDDVVFERGIGIEVRIF